MKISYLKQYALSAMLIAMNLSVTSCAKESGNNPQYIIDMGDNRYMVDYDSLAKSDMHIDDQFRVARALRAGDAYMKGPVASIGGLSADCNVKKKWHIPVGVDCKLEASAAATANLASLGTFAIRSNQSWRPARNRATQPSLILRSLSSRHPATRMLSANR